HLLAGGVVPGPAALDRDHLVADADIGEGAAHHDFVVAAAGAVAVEVGLADLPFEQVVAGRAFLLDRAGRADVVGGDVVAEQAENAGALDVGDGGGFQGDALEIGRVL